MVMVVVRVVVLVVEVLLGHRRPPMDRSTLLVFPLVPWEGDADLVLLTVLEEVGGVHLEDQHGEGSNAISEQKNQVGSKWSVTLTRSFRDTGDSAH